MAAVLYCSYQLDSNFQLTLTISLKWRADTFLALQIDCTLQDSQMRTGKHQTGASRVFSIAASQPGSDHRPRQLTTSAGLMVDLGLNNSYPA